MTGTLQFKHFRNTRFRMCPMPLWLWLCLSASWHRLISQAELQNKSRDRKGEPARLQLYVLRERVQYYPLECSMLLCFASLIPRRSVGMQKQCNFILVVDNQIYKQNIYVFCLFFSRSTMKWYNLKS